VKLCLFHSTEARDACVLDGTVLRLGA